MAENGNGTPPTHALPKCVICETQPITFAHQVYPTPIGMGLVLVWCAKCGHVMATQMISGKDLGVFVADPTSKDGRMIKLA